MRLRVNKHLILYFAVFILLFHFICYLLMANLVVPKPLVDKDLDKQESFISMVNSFSMSGLLSLSS